MKKSIKIILGIFLVIIILILALILIPTPSGRLLNSTFTFFAKTRCAMKQGSWEKAGFGISCVIHYKDGGKVCKENSECVLKKCMLDIDDFFMENKFDFKDKSVIQLSRNKDGYVMGECLRSSYIGWYCEGAELKQPRKDTPDHGVCFTE